MNLFKRLEFWSVLIAGLALVVALMSYKSSMGVERSNFVHRVYDSVDALPLEEQLPFLDTLIEREMDRGRRRDLVRIRREQESIVNSELEKLAKLRAAEEARRRAKEEADQEQRKAAEEEARQRQAEADAAAERAAQARHDRWKDGDVGGPRGDP